LVSVNISADDDFFDAIKNLLRQVDHFYEVKGKTILIKDKDTKTYQVGVPSMKGEYTSAVGGNFLAARASSAGTEGNVKIKSDGNKFDVWDNIEKNLNIILAIVEEGEKFVAEEAAKVQSAREASGKNTDLGEGHITATQKNQNRDVDTNLNDKKTTEGSKESSRQFKFSNRHTSTSGEYFVIDKSIGLITVTAKPVNMKRVDEYINRLKKELFRQISLEAKIIEVILTDNSKIGLDWSNVLKNFRGTVTTNFGTDNLPHFTLAVPSFSVLLNALNEQGDTRVLANPKLTVLNGQPALISVGQDIAYVKKVTKTTTVSATGNQDTFTAEPDNVVAGIALGVMASILDDKKVILHLTPITTDLQDLDENGSIKMTPIGDGTISLGLPKVRIRQMSTMVQVEDGEMLVIGGLIDSSEAKNGSFAPGFGSLPVVKYLFGVEEKTLLKRELVILLTPKII
jgi:general secretion pathway protein D/MSHA biogenesis protein MshL